jgi:hypothetical protein
MIDLVVASGAPQLTSEARERKSLSAWLDTLPPAKERCLRYIYVFLAPSPLEAEPGPSRRSRRVPAIADEPPFLPGASLPLEMLDLPFRIYI